MSDIIDINVAQTVEEVTINVVDNVIQVNINQVNGGGGSQTLNETLVNGNATDGEDIFLSDGDSILLDNGSKLKKGTTNAGNGGNNGIALKCSLDYEFKWEAGRMYIMQQDGVGIRETRYNFNVAPTVNDDDTKGYAVDSRWILDNGDLYICTDATEANAVWQLQSNIPTLQEILDNNNSLVDNNNFQGSGSGAGNSGINNNGFGFSALFNNSGNDVNAFGYYAGTSNAFSGVNLFGKFAYADADNQIVMAKYDDVIRARLSYINLTEDRKFELPDASGTVALTSDIPSPITIDATPTDGSSNAVSSNGVFDDLALRRLTLFCDTPTTTVTGVTISTMFNVYKVDAGTLTNYSQLNVFAQVAKSGGLGVSFLQIFINSSNNFATATEIGRFNLTTTVLYGAIQRRFLLKGGDLKGFTFISSGATDATATATAWGSTALNLANDFWIWIAIDPNASAETHILESVTIEAVLNKA
jgi:hypothetical protein